MGGCKNLSISLFCFVLFVFFVDERPFLGLSKETLNHSSQRRKPVPRVMILMASSLRRSEVSGFNQRIPKYFTD